MKKKKILLIILPIALVIVAGIIGTFIYYKINSDLVYSEVYVEAGTSTCDVKEFLKRDVKGAAFTKDSTFDANVPGDYNLKIKWKMPVFGEQTYDTVLHVTDTTAPVVTLSQDSIQMYTTAVAPTAADLVDSVTDASNCTIDFAEQYDFSKEGSFDVTVLVTDAVGNVTENTITCTVVEDITPPEITGVEPIEIAQGDTVSYKKNIEVTDNLDPAPTLEVDSSEVNVDKRGVYTVKYIATDDAGNVTEKTTTVKIVSAKIAAATEETVYAMADQILS